jgi:hypothetical protein
MLPGNLKVLSNKRLFSVLSEVGPIITYGVWTAEGLSVDWVGLHIYWVKLYEFKSNNSIL